MASSKEEARLLRQFSWTYPLTILGAHIAFMPFFALLLPRRIASVVGSAGLVELSWVLLLGAAVASFANIVAGHWSDRWLDHYGSRRGIIAIGLGFLTLSYIWLSVAVTIPSIGLAIIIFQLALNIFFGPAGALLSDYVPDASKGRISGWCNAALPISSILTAALAAAYPVDSPAAFLVTIAAALLCIGPLMILWPHRLALQSRASNPENQSADDGALDGANDGANDGASDSTGDSDFDSNAGSYQDHTRFDFLIAWCARFLIQIGAAIVLGYLFTMLALKAGQNGFPPSATEAMAVLPIFAAIAGFAGAIISGYISDAIGKRIVPVSLCAAIAAVSLAVLAWGNAWAVFGLAYASFHLGLAAFLAIDSALVAQLVSGNSRRGMWLGMMNLTNTLPGVLGPALTLLAIGAFAQVEVLQKVTGIAAVAALIASALVLRIRTVK